MAQLGFHGAVGALVAGAASSGKPVTRGRKAMVFGYVLGNILPDTDFFLLGPLYIVSSELGLSMHRTWSHSVLALLVGLVATYVISGMSKGERRETARAMGLGVVLGMATHIAMDILIWFSSVDLLWPLGAWGIGSRVDLWVSVRQGIPGVVNSILGAADYLAFAVYFIYLKALARRYGTDQAFLPRLEFFTNLQWVLFALYMVLAFVVDRGLFDIIHYAVFILVMLPITLYVTFKMRATVESIGTPVGAGAGKSVPA